MVDLSAYATEEELVALMGQSDGKGAENDPYANLRRCVEGPFDNADVQLARSATTGEGRR